MLELLDYVYITILIIAILTIKTIIYHVFFKKDNEKIETFFSATTSPQQCGPLKWFVDNHNYFESLSNNLNSNNFTKLNYFGNCMSNHDDYTDYILGGSNRIFLDASITLGMFNCNEPVSWRNPRDILVSRLYTRSMKGYANEIVPNYDDTGESGTGGELFIKAKDGFVQIDGSMLIDGGIVVQNDIFSLSNIFSIGSLISYGSNIFTRSISVGHSISADSISTNSISTSNISTSNISTPGDRVLGIYGNVDISKKLRVNTSGSAGHDRLIVHTSREGDTVKYFYVNAEDRFGIHEWEPGCPGGQQLCSHTTTCMTPEECCDADPDPNRYWSGGRCTNFDTDGF